MTQLPRVITDDVLSDNLIELLDGKIERLPWTTLEGPDDDSIDGAVSYTHLTLPTTPYV